MQAQPPIANAGISYTVCPATAATFTLGGSPTGSGGVGPYTFKWRPTASLIPLSDSVAQNPVASPTTTTTYTVIVKGANGESGSSTAKITFLNYSINAGKDTTIEAGQTITMHAQANGALGVYWQPPTGNIYNQNSLTPDVFPSQTITYTVSAVYPGGCTLYDYVKVTVIPSTKLFFYNSFTPNGDGVNDFFYIGNLGEYPDNVLEIYNRYGQKVYTQTSYKNDWDGKYLNAELPAGTYFYILDTKSESGGKYKGSVTIIK